MALAVARRGAQLVIATDAEVGAIEGTTKYSVAIHVGKKVVHGIVDIGRDTPINPYRLGFSAYDVTYKLGFFGGLRAKSIAIGDGKSHALKRP